MQNNLKTLKQIFFQEKKAAFVNKAETNLKNNIK